MLQYEHFPPIQCFIHRVDDTVFSVHYSIFSVEEGLRIPVLVVLNKKVTTFDKKSNLKLGLIQTRQLH